MKHLSQLFHTLLLKRQGFCFSKAWQLAGFNTRQQNYSKEILLAVVLLIAYLIVGYNDLKEAEVTATTEKEQRIKVEACTRGFRDGMRPHER